MWQPSATDFYAHQAAAGMACLVLANELFLAVKRVSLLGNKRTQGVANINLSYVSDKDFSNQILIISLLIEMFTH